MLHGQHGGVIDDFPGINTNYDINLRPLNLACARTAKRRGAQCLREVIFALCGELLPCSSMQQAARRKRRKPQCF